MELDLVKVKDFILEIVDKVGEYQKNIVLNFASNDTVDSGIGISTKSGAVDYVSEIDKESERQIVSMILERYPYHNIIGEENVYPKTDSPFSWYIDPIDGTSNFIRGIPMWSISIGLVYENKPILGVIYIPYFKDTYWAINGMGAFKNDRQIHVSKKQNIENALYVMGFSNKSKHENCSAELIKMLKVNSDVRRLGSAAINLCYIAQGSFDFFYQPKLSPYDFMAGYVIVLEAGGIFESQASLFENTQILVSCNKVIHDKVKELLN